MHGWDAQVSGSRHQQAASETSDHSVLRSAPQRNSLVSCLACSIDLLHLGGLVGSTLHLLQWWQIVIIAEAFVVIVDAQSELNHAVDTTSELSRLVQIEARGQQGGVEEEPDQVLHGLVRLVG